MKPSKTRQKRIMMALYQTEAFNTRMTLSWHIRQNEPLCAVVKHWHTADLARAKEARIAAGPVLP